MLTIGMLCCSLKFIHGSEEKRYQGKRDLSELSSFADEMLKYKEEQKVRLRLL